MGRIRLGKVASETAPPAGQVTFFAKSDDNLYVKLATGDEFQLINSGTPGALGYSVEQIEIDSTQELNKQITLSLTPSFPEKTLLYIDGGAPAFYTLDFEVTGDVLSWSGKRLDGLLEQGDLVRIVYF